MGKLEATSSASTMNAELQAQLDRAIAATRKEEAEKLALEQV